MSPDRSHNKVLACAATLACCLFVDSAVAQTGFMVGKGSYPLSVAEKIQAEAGVPNGNARVRYSTTPVTYRTGEIAYWPKTNPVHIWLRNDKGDPKKPGAPGVEWLEFFPQGSHTHAVVQLVSSDGNDGWADIYATTAASTRILLGSFDTKNLGTNFVVVRAPFVMKSLIVAQRGTYGHVQLDWVGFTTGTYYGKRCSNAGWVTVRGPIYVTSSTNKLEFEHASAPSQSISVLVLGSRRTNLQLGSCFRLLTPPYPVFVGSKLRIPANSDEAAVGSTFFLQFHAVTSSFEILSSDAAEITLTK